MKKNNLETADASSFSRRYGRYCCELDKENGLINDRVRWLLVSQSILFAAAQFGGPSPNVSIVRIVAWVGCALSVTIWFSVLAAIMSFRRYFRRLIQFCPPACDDNQDFPQLHRRTFNIVLGFVAPFVLPIVFGVAWLLVIFN